MTLAMLTPPRAGADWHLELVSAKPFEAKLVSRISGRNVGADRMQLLIAVPPRTEEQPDVTSKASVTLGGESASFQSGLDDNPLRRNYLELRAPVKDQVWVEGVVVEQAFAGTVRRYRLTPGKGTRVGPPLTAAERAVYTAATDAYPLKSPDFQALLRDNGLTWNRGTEDAVGFARRAYRFTKGYYRYGKPVSENAIEVLRNRQGECGDISLTFNAILRANGIPARAKIGRWIENGKGTEVAQSVHVRSEFYVDEVGWIPVDVTAGMEATVADEGKYFGYHAGVDFLTLHLDPDLAVVEWGSQMRRTLKWVQQVQVLLWGPNVDFGKLSHHETYSRIR